MPDHARDASVQDQRVSLERILALVQQLKPLDRQAMLLYLEGMDGASIGEIIGISAVSVATKIHRIKNILARRFHGGERDAE
jgi:RNA polymerase sigma-70 factor (ECF subfamily)